MAKKKLCLEPLYLAACNIGSSPGLAGITYYAKHCAAFNSNVTNRYVTIRPYTDPDSTTINLVYLQNSA